VSKVGHFFSRTVKLARAMRTIRWRCLLEIWYEWERSNR